MNNRFWVVLTTTYRLGSSESEYTESTWDTRREARERVAKLRKCIHTADHNNTYRIMRVEPEIPIRGVISGIVPGRVRRGPDMKDVIFPGYRLEVDVDYDGNSVSYSDIYDLLRKGLIECKVVIERKVTYDKGKSN